MGTKIIQTPRSTAVTLSDAQLKAANVTPQRLIPAPGPNRLIIPLAVQLYAHFVVPYTACRDFDALVIGHGSTLQAVALTPVAQLFNAGPDTPLNDVLTNVNGGPDHLTRLPVPLASYSDGWGETTPSAHASVLTNYLNQPLAVTLRPASAVLSGGGSANTLTFAILYEIYDVSARQFGVEFIP